MDKTLDSLDISFRPLVDKFLAKLVEAQIPVVIVNTRRTEWEQAQNLQNGVSWVKHSKHQDGLAIDICPFDTYSLHGDDKLKWDANDPIWQKIGTIGKQLGLVWGGDWTKKDMGHFELG